jgi:hypothetical protein
MYAILYLPQGEYVEQYWQAKPVTFSRLEFAVEMLDYVILHHITETPYLFTPCGKTGGTSLKSNIPKHLFQILEVDYVSDTLLARSKNN